MIDKELLRMVIYSVYSSAYSLGYRHGIDEFMSELEKIDEREDCCNTHLHHIINALYEVKK